MTLVQTLTEHDGASSSESLYYNYRSEELLLFREYPPRDSTSLSESPYYNYHRNEVLLYSGYPQRGGASLSEFSPENYAASKQQQLLTSRPEKLITVKVISLYIKNTLCFQFAKINY